MSEKEEMESVSEENIIQDEEIQLSEEENKKNPTKKQLKKGIIFLSSLPPYMNVSQIREIFSEYGNVGRVYLQLAEKDVSKKGKKKPKKNVANKFTEGWVEFERKSIAKQVVELLNNKQVSTQKRSKHFDCIWNLKYLSHFKWTHLHERLAYEKAARRQKLRAEIQLAKKKTNFFTANLDKRRKNKTVENVEFKDIVDNNSGDRNKKEDLPEGGGDRKEFLSSLFA